MNKEVRKLVQSISQMPGVEVRDGGKHLTVFMDDKFVYTLGKTPSDHRWRDNALSGLRAAGITPSPRPPKAMMTTVAISQDKLRERLHEVGSMADFARYLVDEVAPVTGLRSFRDAKSCASSLTQFKNGQTHELREWAAVLVDQGLRMQAKVNGQKQRADAVEAIATRLDIAPEQLVPESLSPETVEAAAITLRIDSAQLVETLARFGITLEIS